MNSQQPVEIILNVYRLGDPNDEQMTKLQFLAGLGLGLYHSGIEINGVEYAYGGDPNNPGTGVFQTIPMTVMGATYYESFVLGTVSDNKKIYEVLRELRSEFIANEYSLVSKNCNHFAEELSMRLLGKRLPSYINRLAKAGEWVKFALPQSCKSLNPVPSDGNKGRPF